MSNSRYESGLGFQASGLSVKGIVCAVPKAEIRNDYFYERFGQEAVSDVVKMIGVESRRWVNDGQTTADLCEGAATSLLSDLNWAPESVDALIFISQTPDYRLPATACALHGRLKLKKACAAFDVNLGCSGYAYGLWLASRLLDGHSIRRVLLLVGDTISKTIDPSDRSTALVFGDAGSATAIEFDEAGEDSYYITGADGNGERNLMIPQGGFKQYDQGDTRLEGKDPSSLFMDGGEIFNFTLRHIPQLVADILSLSAVEQNEVDAFLFHQANSFMLKHLIKKTKLSAAQAPINIDRFGNTSSASIPLLIADQLPKMRESKTRVAMFGFGVGYSWSAAMLNIGPLAVNKVIEI